MGLLLWVVVRIVVVVVVGGVLVVVVVGAGVGLLLDKKGCRLGFNSWW